MGNLLQFRKRIPPEETLPPGTEEGGLALSETVLEFCSIILEQGCCDIVFQIAMFLYSIDAYAHKEDIENIRMQFGNKSLEALLNCAKKSEPEDWAEEPSYYLALAKEIHFRQTHE